MLLRLCACVVLASALSAAPASAANPRPATVPALQKWTGATGSFKLTTKARVVYAPRWKRELAAEAKQLARDLGLKARKTRKSKPGDVVMKMGAKGGVPTEGYVLKVGHKRLTIAARHPRGAFYGGRTLVQLTKKSKRIPRGTARDWPRYPERGLMLDNGRQFFSRAWLEDRIAEMAGIKLNLLHLHFSDNQGYRLESETHPEIVTEPYLTKRDVAALVKFAARHHVTIVPELDSPGHLEAALKPHPELQLTNVFGQRQPDKLDVTLPAARQFIADLLGEYLPLFPGPWWHMGADEYLGIASTENDYELYPQLEAFADEKYGEGANGKDAVIDFINFVGDLAESGGGKRLRIWSDGMGGGSGLVPIDPGAAVDWWENRTSADPNALMAEGRDVMNAGWWPLYYVTGGPLESLRATEEEMYEEWSPEHFEGPWSTRWGGGPPEPPPYFVPADAPRQLGAQLNVWNDDPDNMSAEEIAAGIAPRLRILAQKTWGSPQLTDSYAEFVAQTR